MSLLKLANLTSQNSIDMKSKYCEMPLIQKPYLRPWFSWLQYEIFPTIAVNGLSYTLYLWLSITHPKVSSVYHMARYKNWYPTPISSTKTSYERNSNRQSGNFISQLMYGVHQIIRLFLEHVCNSWRPIKKKPDKLYLLYQNFLV